MKLILNITRTIISLLLNAHVLEHAQIIFSHSNRREEMESYLQGLEIQAILELLLPEFAPIAPTSHGGPPTTSEYKEITEEEMKYLQDLNNNTNTVLSPTLG